MSELKLVKQIIKLGILDLKSKKKMKKHKKHKASTVPMLRGANFTPVSGGGLRSNKQHKGHYNPQQQLHRDFISASQPASQRPNTDSLRLRDEQLALNTRQMEQKIELEYQKTHLNYREQEIGHILGNIVNYLDDNHDEATTYGSATFIPQIPPDHNVSYGQVYSNAIRREQPTTTQNPVPTAAATATTEATTTAAAATAATTSAAVETPTQIKQENAPISALKESLNRFKEGFKGGTAMGRNHFPNPLLNPTNRHIKEEKMEQEPKETREQREQRIYESQFEKSIREEDKQHYADAEHQRIPKWDGTFQYHNPAAAKQSGTKTGFGDTYTGMFSSQGSNIPTPIKSRSHTIFDNQLEEEAYDVYDFSRRDTSSGSPRLRGSSARN